MISIRDLGAADLVYLLRARGISTRVADAMAQVPREEFVPTNVRGQAWEDHPLPIGYGQTISQPSLVATMIDAVDFRAGARALDVGTGSGYQAALLACLGADVRSVERIGALAEASRETLARLGWPVPVKWGDGSKGWPDFAPFDAIMVAAAADAIPDALIEQLAAPTDHPERRGGRLILPLRDGRWGQRLVLVERTATGYTRRDLGSVAFVPLVVDGR